METLQVLDMSHSTVTNPMAPDLPLFLPNLRMLNLTSCSLPGRPPDGELQGSAGD